MYFNKFFFLSYFLYSVCLEWSLLFVFQFSHSVVSNSVTPWTAAHRPPCPSLTPGVYSNSCPSSQWCRPTFSSPVVFSSHLQSFPASGSFPMSQFFASGGRSIGTFSFNISTSNEYSRLKAFRTDWLDLLAVQGTLKSLLQHHLCLGGVRWYHGPTLQMRKLKPERGSTFPKVTKTLGRLSQVWTPQPVSPSPAPMSGPRGTSEVPACEFQTPAPEPPCLQGACAHDVFPSWWLEILKTIPHWRYIPVLQSVQCWNLGSGQVVSKQLRVFRFLHFAFPGILGWYCP